MVIHTRRRVQAVTYTYYLGIDRDASKLWTSAPTFTKYSCSRRIENYFEIGKYIDTMQQASVKLEIRKLQKHPLLVINYYKGEQWEIVFIVKINSAKKGEFYST
jgi:hypothetical protein